MENTDVTCRLPYPPQCVMQQRYVLGGGEPMNKWLERGI
jgi:hypothetical protein